MITQAEEKGTELDFVKMSQIIKNFNNTQFTEFIRSIMQLKLDHQAKEYYLKLSYLDHARNNKVNVDKMTDPLEATNVITEKAEIAKMLHKKYTKLFAAGLDHKQE